jgi:uncharacterized protein GlcG (DUF336 family)
MKTMSKRAYALIALVLASSGMMASTAQAQERSATVSVKLLASHLASQAVAAALQECEGRGYQVSVTLLGRDGHLLAMLRDPLASPLTIDISRGKAYAAASFRASTTELSETMGNGSLRFANDVLFSQGGLPIEVGGHFFGGIGVSGASAEVDEICANAGIEAIADTLEFAE